MTKKDSPENSHSLKISQLSNALQTKALTNNKVKWPTLWLC